MATPIQRFVDASDRERCLEKVLIRETIPFVPYEREGGREPDCGSPYMFKGKRSGNFTPINRRIDIVYRLCHGESLRATARAVGVHKDTVMRMRLNMGKGAAALIRRCGYGDQLVPEAYEFLALRRQDYVDSWGRLISLMATCPRSDPAWDAELALVVAFRLFVVRPFGDDDPRGPFALCDGKINSAWKIDDLVQALLRENDVPS